jgi:hypothetical protein
METQNDLGVNGEKRNYLLQIKLSKSQIEALRIRAAAEGFKTISSFVRTRCFDSVSQEVKLNKILELLKEKKNGTH